jgi:hypothetical protein
MRLKETWRQLLAGVLAAATFTLVHLFFDIQWLPALGIALAIYIASLLLIERAPEDDEVYLHENLTQYDLDKAVLYCRQAAKKLQHISGMSHIDSSTAQAMKSLSSLINHIADNYKDDPRDLKHSLSLVNHYLPRLLSIVQSFETLSNKSLTRESQHRLRHIGEQIRDYVPHFQSIYNACLENDFKRLELETGVLGDVMKIETR